MLSGWPQTWNTQGFLWTWEKGILREFCATSGKNCSKQSIFNSSCIWSESAVVICYIAGVDVEWPLIKVIITFTFCCNNLWKSKFMALEKPGILGIFSPTLWPPWLCKDKGVPYLYERWSRSWSWSRGSQPSDDLVINSPVGWRYSPRGPRLPSQLQSVTVVWPPAPKYAAWWQRRPGSLPSSETARSWTRDLSVVSPTP